MVLLLMLLFSPYVESKVEQDLEERWTEKARQLDKVADEQFLSKAVVITRKVLHSEEEAVKRLMALVLSLPDDSIDMNLQRLNSDSFQEQQELPLFAHSPRVYRLQVAGFTNRWAVKVFTLASQKTAMASDLLVRSLLKDQDKKYLLTLPFDADGQQLFTALVHYSFGKYAREEHTGAEMSIALNLMPLIEDAIPLSHVFQSLIDSDGRFDEEDLAQALEAVGRGLGELHQMNRALKMRVPEESQNFLVWEANENLLRREEQQEDESATRTPFDHLTFGFFESITNILKEKDHDPRSSTLGGGVLFVLSNIWETVLETDGWYPTLIHGDASPKNLLWIPPSKVLQIERSLGAEPGDQEGEIVDEMISTRGAPSCGKLLMLDFTKAALSLDWKKDKLVFVGHEAFDLHFLLTVINLQFMPPLNSALLGVLQSAYLEVSCPVNTIEECQVSEAYHAFFKMATMALIGADHLIKAVENAFLHGGFQE